MAARGMLRLLVLLVSLATTVAVYTGTYNATTGPDYYGAVAVASYGSGVPPQS